MSLRKEYALILILLLFTNTYENNEKISCFQIPFCQRNMKTEKQVPSYYVDLNTINLNDNIVSGTITNYNKEFIPNTNDLIFSIYILKHGIFRIKIKPFNSNRFELNEKDLPFDLENSKKSNSEFKYSMSDNSLVIYYYENNDITGFSTDNSDKVKYELILNYKPFIIEYKVENKVIYSINSKNLFDIEFPSIDFTPNEDDAMESIKLDVTINSCDYIAGLPERASPLYLKDTTKQEYYHFYNVDIFKYEAEQYSGLYGVIPFIMSYSHSGSFINGFIWNNPSETFISLETKDNNNKELLFLSEGGIFDFSFFTDKTISDFYSKFRLYLGKTPMPPLYALGYHQSRFSYKDLRDVSDVDSKFDEYNVPYDALWFDIDHTDQKRYFTWNSHFDGVNEFIKTLFKKGRTPIMIIDPHIKVDKNYHIYSEAYNKNYFMKYENKDFVGLSWCDDASFLDFFQEDVRTFWKNLIKNNENNYFFDYNITGIWNDMNEPSVFEISRQTVPKEATILYNGTQYHHRYVHNLYGYFFHKTTYDALLEKFENKRPFVLTRSFFLGSHKSAAVWTGDSISSFDDLKISLPMLLTFSISGFSFVGADVGGFAQNDKFSPYERYISVALYIRWYQFGAFYPFFRGHSHSFTNRREIWLFTEDEFEKMKNAILIRYQILNYIYTTFYYHYLTSIPIMKPIWFEYQNDLAFDKYANDEFFFGDSLLIRPVLTEEEHNSNKIKTYLPEDKRWYDFYDLNEVKQNGEVEYPINIDKIGVFMKGGKIFYKKMRARRSSATMNNDPFTLFVCLNNEMKSEGKIYFDSQNDLNYTLNKNSIVAMYFTVNELDIFWEKFHYITSFKIEKIYVIGLNNIRNIKSIMLMKENDEKNIKKLEFIINEEKNLVEIPGIIKDLQIGISMKKAKIIFNYYS